CEGRRKTAHCPSPLLIVHHWYTCANDTSAYVRSTYVIRMNEQLGTCVHCVCAVWQLSSYPYKRASRMPQRVGHQPCGGRSTRSHSSIIPARPESITIAEQLQAITSSELRE